MALADVAIALAESGKVPDALVRAGIRRLLADQLRRAGPPGSSRRAADREALRERLRNGPIAVHPDAANRQHYEVPAEFFRLFLGPRLKYSAGYWPEGVHSLAAAEEAMLDLTCRRARLADGMSVLDLGCGWGSLSLWIAERYPGCRVVAVSNSAGQREHIAAECRERGFAGVETLTSDINDFEPGRRFDRVISVEMFEHVRNHERLLERVAGWLEPGGKLFAHVFAHRELAYLYETGEEESWMARHFFTGGMMPSEDWLAGFDRDFRQLERWRINGRHYTATLEAWLRQLDAVRPRAQALLAGAGEPDPARQLRRWRIFLMASAELFGYAGGEEWLVSHALFEPQEKPR
jgi:cyclopropane-fatty-acyl-phospholipid synthase